MSSSSKRKSRPDDVTSHHTKKSGASVGRLQHDSKSKNHDKLSHHSKSKSWDSSLDSNEKKLQDGVVAARGSNGKQLPGGERSIKKEDVRTKTSQKDCKTATMARSTGCKTAETDVSNDGCNEMVSENSRTSDLWAGFALGDWGHSRTTDRPSIASKSDLDESSSHCGSVASRGNLPAKELKKSSKVDAKLRQDEQKKSSDKSHKSDKQSLHSVKKKSHQSSNDISRLGGKSLNSSSKQSLVTERSINQNQAVKDQSTPNTEALLKSPSRGLSFFSGSKTVPNVTHSSAYKTPTVKTTSKPEAPVHVDRSPPVFTKVKLNGLRVFVDKTLRSDAKLWQLVRVTLVNCDQMIAASLAKQRDTLARKTGGGLSSVSTASSHDRDKQKASQKEKRENDAGQMFVKKRTHSSDSSQSDDHVQKKSFDKMRSKDSGRHQKSNNRKSSKDKKSTDRAKYHSENRLLDTSPSRSSDIHLESHSHSSRKSLHESKSHGSSKSQCERESSQSIKSQREVESSQSSKSKGERERNSK